MARGGLVFKVKRAASRHGSQDSPSHSRGWSCSRFPGILATWVV